MVKLLIKASPYTRVQNQISTRIDLFVLFYCQVKLSEVCTLHLELVKMNRPLITKLSVKSKWFIFYS